MPAIDSRHVSPRRRRHGPWLWGTVLTILFLGPALLYLARQPLLIAAARALTIDDTEVPADYLVVLGGGDERPFAAAELYRQGFAPKVVIFQHKTDRIIDLGLTPTPDELYRKVLELEGVPASAIIRLPGVVVSSWDEARALQRLLVSHPARRVIVVTSAEHTRRARWVFRKVLDGMPVQVQMAPARHSSFDETNWWKDDEGALAYLHEYLKLPFYWIRYTFNDEQTHETSALPPPGERGAE